MSTGSVSIHTSATGHIDSRTTAEKRYQRHHIGRPCRSSTSNACRFTICAHPCAHRSCWHLYAANVPGSSVITTVCGRNLDWYPAQ